MTNKEKDSLRNETLLSINSHNPRKAFGSLRDFKSTAAPSLYKLLMGDAEFLGDDLPDGFYNAMIDLKDQDSMDTSHDQPQWHSYASPYLQPNSEYS